MSHPPGSRIGHYEIISLLGVGGMGEVYRARDVRLGREVALKILTGKATADAERLQRFELEAKAASALNHPNIVTIHEVGEENNEHYLVTEFVGGETLRDRMRKERLTLRDALDIAKQIASALSAAHENGIIHRDIKPENVMLRPDGLVKILDFGLAKLTEKQKTSSNSGATNPIDFRTDPGKVMGTPHYMSPEQARGVEIDSRTDIFSLGVVLYEMIAGRPPFEGETPSDLIAEILKTEPLSIMDFAPGAPPEVQHVVSRMIQKKPADRYQQATELHLELKTLKRSLKSATGPTNWDTAPLKPLENLTDYSTRYVDRDDEDTRNTQTLPKNPKH